MITIALLAACLSAAPEPEPSVPVTAPTEAPTQVTPAVTPAVAKPSPGAQTEDERNSIDVFKAVAPATVFVTQTQVVVDRFRRRAQEVPAGSGSGFLWDNNGHVVTNYHVIADARSLTVTLHDGSEWPATLVGGDPRKDTAVLKIAAPTDKLVAIRRPGEAHTLEVGQKTLAIGNPFGLDHTLTTGVVSAVGREVQGFGGVTITGMIQTDASINPGNSGGPLLDSQGRLVGMNTMIFSESGSSAGIGFAVPYATIDRVVTQIITKGRVEQVGIGINLLDDRLARRNGIDGLVITDVAPGSPAHQAGLRGLGRGPRGPVLGDVITDIDGKPTPTYDALYTALDPRAPGEKVKVGYLREGKREEVEVALVVLNDL